jgi:hypothetical protein
MHGAQNPPGSQRERLSEAIGALREYEPLAVQLLELAVLLDRLAGIALQDVEAVNDTGGTTQTCKAMEHLREAVDERRHVHVDIAMRHVAQALEHLQPK